MSMQHRKGVSYRANMDDKLTGPCGKCRESPGMHSGKSGTIVAHRKTASSARGRDIATP